MRELFLRSGTPSQPRASRLGVSTWHLGRESLSGISVGRHLSRASLCGISVGCHLGRASLCGISVGRHLGRASLCGISVGQLGSASSRSGFSVWHATKHALNMHQKHPLYRTLPHLHPKNTLRMHLLKKSYPCRIIPESATTLRHGPPRATSVPRPNF